MDLKGIDIQLNKTRQEYLNALEKSLLEIQGTIRELQVKEAEILKEIHKVTPSNPSSLNEVVGAYPAKSTWKDRIVYLMKKHNKPLTSRQIADEIQELEPDLELSQPIIKSISATLVQNKGNVFTKVNRENGKEYLYFLNT